MITFLVTLLLISVLVFVVWASKRAEKAGATSVTAEEQAELLARVQEAEEIEREVIAANPNRRAVDRLREQRHRRE